MSLLLHLAFFLSGLAALLFEALWFYQAGLGLGNSIWASSLVLAAFMGGLGVGNGLVGSFGHRIRYPVRLYALLELVIAISGFGLVCVLPVITSWLVPIFRPFLEATAGLNALRLGVSFGLLLIPASAMGATMPLLVFALFRRDPRFGAVMGRLYGWNTLGAVVGAVLGDAFLIGRFGIYGAAGCAAAVNCSAAVLALALSKRIEGEASRAAQTLEPADRMPARLTGRAKMLLLAAAGSGATLLAFEVVWYRFLLLWVRGTSLAFAVMLAVVLAGIGLGGLFASRLLSSRENAFRLLPGLTALSGALCVGTYAGFEFIPRWTGIDVAWSFQRVIILSFPLMFPASFTSGVIFVFLGEALNRESPGETRSAGFLTLANTMGAMLGSLVAGFILLPTIGIERSIFVLSASYGLVTAATMLGGLQPNTLLQRIAAYAGGAMLVVSIAQFPSGLMLQNFVLQAVSKYVRAPTPALTTKPLELREGLTETLMYLEDFVFGEPYSHRLITNNYSMSGTLPSSARYMKLFVYLPVALHSEPRDALLISYGVGITAKALTDTAGLERIDIVDISKDILEMSHLVFPDPASHPLNDPRVNVHIEDGRYFLQTSDRRFDIITGEPPPPKMAGVVSLYTREYFELVRDRLAEGGIATYWLPTHSLGEDDAKAIIRAFCDAFQDCSLWGGAGYDFMLVGTREATGATLEEFERQWQDPVVGPDIRALGFEHPEQLAALYMGGREYLLELVGDISSLTDAYPKRLQEAAIDHRDRFRFWNYGGGPRLRFEKDPVVARLFPRPIIDRALDYFDDQFEIQQSLMIVGSRSLMSGMHSTKKLPVIHSWLSETDLISAPLFLLGSNARHVAAVEAAWKKGFRAGSIRYHRGVSALVQRDFEAAALHFGSSIPRDPLYDVSRMFEIYSLAMAKQCDPARSRLRALSFDVGLPPEYPGFGDFVGELCPTS